MPRAISGRISSEVPTSSSATGLRIHASAIWSALSLTIVSQTGRPVSMHRVYGVPAG